MHREIVSERLREVLEICLRIPAILTRAKIAATWPALALGLAPFGLTLRMSVIGPIVPDMALRSPIAVYLVNVLGL